MTESGGDIDAADSLHELCYAAVLRADRRAQNLQIAAWIIVVLSFAGFAVGLVAASLDDEDTPAPAMLILAAASLFVGLVTGAVLFGLGSIVETNGRTLHLQLLDSMADDADE